jgi:hypothetical protein
MLLPLNILSEFSTGGTIHWEEFKKYDILIIYLVNYSLRESVDEM